MTENYKVVIVTPAGRRRYMQYLVPFIIADDVVDRYDIWVNTHNGADIAFFKRVAAKYPKVNLVMQPDGIVNGNKSINAFFRNCCEEDTIYLRLDDDICWLEKDMIKKMVRFRIDNPDYFLVSPLVINNSLSTYTLQVTNKLNLREYCYSYCMHPILWRSGDFAFEIHDWFIKNYLIPNKVSDLYCGRHEWASARFSINAIMWFGKEFKKFNGIVLGDEEDFVSCIYPTKIGKSNCINGDAIVSHFAFFPQREMLDKMHILERYGEYLHQVWSKDSILSSIDNTIQEIMEDIANNEEELLKNPSPYKRVESVTIKDNNHTVVKKILRNFLPPIIFKLCIKTRNEKYINMII